MRAGRKLGCCRLAPDLKLRFVINESYTQPSNELPILAQSRKRNPSSDLSTEGEMMGFAIARRKTRVNALVARPILHALHFRRIDRAYRHGAKQALDIL